MSDDFEQEMKRVSLRYVPPRLTKREYFAGLAMQGLCADPNNHDLFSSIEHAAQNAVAIADVLLAELERAE